MSRSIIIDPRSEDAKNAPIEIFREVGRGPGIYVVAGEESYPDPPQTKIGAATREGTKRNAAPDLDNREIPLGVIVIEGSEPAATNLVTNPSIKNAAAGYVAISGGTPTQITTDAAFGENCLQIVTPATAGAGARSEVVTVPASSPVAGLVWVKAPAGVSIVVGLQELTAALAVVGTTSTTIVGTGDWQEAEVSRSFGGTGVRAAIAVTQQAATAQTFYADAFAIAVSSAPLGSYVDGDLPGSTWTGTAHASTSSRPAPGGARMDAMVRDIEEKVGKIADEGGTYSRQFTAGRGIFDLEGAAFGDGAHNGRQYAQGIQRYSLTFEAAPYLRGASSTRTVHSETAAPVMSWEEAAPDGSVSSLGTLELTEASAVERRGLVVGVEVADYASGAANTEPYLQAEALTPLGGGAIATQSGAQGGGSNNVIETTLGADWGGVLQTTKLAGSADLAHVGTFVVWARVYAPATNVGDVSLRFAYAQGDLTTEKLNDVWSVPGKGDFYLARLGTIRIKKVATGTQRWRGRIIGLSSAGGDKIRIDDLRIVPAGESYVECSAPATLKPPNNYVARETFTQSGALTGKTLPTGQTWTAGPGVDADDFSVNGSGIATRTAVSDSGTAPGFGRGRRLTTNQNQATLAASIDVATNRVDTALGLGMTLREVDANNLLHCTVVPSGTNAEGWFITKVVGGVQTIIASQRFSGAVLLPNTFYRLQIYIDATGRLEVYFGTPATTMERVAVVTDAALATGGALATGKAGLLDYYTNNVATTRSYKNFRLWTPAFEVVCHPSKKVYWSDAGVERDDLTGSGRSRVHPDGDLLKIPPRRRSGRQLRVVSFMSRGDLGDLPDTDPGDDHSSQLTVTPRYRSVRA